MATASGWMCVAFIVLAALVPLGHRAFTRRRPAVRSRWIGWHVVIGAAAALFAFLHTVTVLPVLGSPTAIAGGMAAIAPAGLAFFVVVAHVGIGLRLRKPELKERVVLRRRHAMTAATVALAVAVHIIVLLRSG
jgi:hypothetical protein